jgi:hypothetical protein
MHTEFWSETLKGRDHLKGLVKDGRIVFKWILENRMICGLDSSDLGYETVLSSCEHGNEPSDSIKGWEFLD